MHNGQHCLSFCKGAALRVDLKFAFDIWLSILATSPKIELLCCIAKAANLHTRMEIVRLDLSKCASKQRMPIMKISKTRNSPNYTRDDRRKSLGCLYSSFGEAERTSNYFRRAPFRALVPDDDTVMRAVLGPSACPPASLRRAA
jgi:hypothetical protein